MDQGKEQDEKYKNGDNAALEWLVGEYRRGLILYLNGIVGDMNDAEDLCEDTFFRLITRKPDFDGRSSFKTWFYRIGRSLAIDHLRHKNHLPRASMADAEAEADRFSLEGQYIKTERERVLMSKLQNLTELDRELIWLTYFEGLTAEEAARITNKTERSVNKALSRARKDLKMMMEREGYGNED